MEGTGSDRDAIREDMHLEESLARELELLEGKAERLEARRERLRAALEHAEQSTPVEPEKSEAGQ